MYKLTVIIPYYQQQAGVLSRTLRSISAQSAFCEIEQLIIVDDGSPIAAQTELAAQAQELIAITHVICQCNRGVSSARNTGLSYAHGKAQYIALLDSDDIWRPSHVAQMLRAFELGAQFYFTNFIQPDQSISAFKRAGKMVLDQHKKIEGSTYSYQHDMMEQILTGNIIGTPTVGFCSAKYSKLRFNEELRFAGEDYLFWLDIAASDPNIMFNHQVLTECGKGVNIFASAAWGTKHLQQRLVDELNFKKLVVRKYLLTNSTLAVVNQQLWRNRKKIILNNVSRLKHLQWSAFFDLLKIAIADPKLLIALFKA